MRDPNYPEILIDSDLHLSDSANHTIYYNVMLRVLGIDHIDARYLYFDKETGLAKRHPDRETNSFTRDQFTPFIAYEAIKYVSTHIPVLIKSTFAVKRFYELVLSNYGLFFNSVESDLDPKPWWNRDWLNIQTRSLWARACNSRRWLHYLGDLNLYFTIRYNDAYTPERNADENVHMHLIGSLLNRPTFITHLCWKYYFTKTKRPWADKIEAFFDRNGTYYPEIIPVAIKAISKLLKEHYNIETDHPHAA